MIRWYHRWACLDIMWMGQPATEERAEGYLTRRGARLRAAQATRYGFRCGVVPARDVRRRRYSSSGTG